MHLTGEARDFFIDHTGLAPAYRASRPDSACKPGSAWRVWRPPDDGQKNNTCLISKICCRQRASWIPRRESGLPLYYIAAGGIGK